MPVAEIPQAAAPAAPAPAAQPEIKVSQMTPAGSTPATPPKPGSAKERMAQELRNKFSEPDPAPAAAPAKTPEAAPKPGEPVPEVVDPPAGEVVTDPKADPKKGKVSPWKLLDDERKARAQEVARVQELEKRAIAPEKWEEYQKRQKEVETRNKELEDHMRYVDYSQSKEFQEKYQKPYEDSWKRAMTDLRELSVEDPQTGQLRPFEASDMLEIVNLPLPEARKVAVDKYGDFADDIMQQRKEIRRLHDEQASALTEAKKSGAERVKQQMEEQQRAQTERSQAILKEWTEENQAVLKDEKYGKYFTPQEGNEEVNKRLEKGFALADQAFSESPANPNLTPEQRREIVKRHAAVRNRCAAFGSLVYQHQQAQSQIELLKKELAELKAADPDAIDPGKGGGAGASPSATGGTAMSRVQAELRKYAK